MTAGLVQPGGALRRRARRGGEDPGKQALGAVGALLAVASLAVPLAASSLTDEDRLREMRRELARLEAELHELSGREQGVLGQLERLGAELRLRGAELGETELRLASVTRKLDAQRVRLARLKERQREREGYLAFRLREIYKAGPNRELRRLIGGETVEGYWAGLRYASFLSERDRTILRAFRADAEGIAAERSVLGQRQAELEATGRELVAARDRLGQSRRRREALLHTIRVDKTKRKAAIDELRSASQELSRLVDSLDPGRSRPALDVNKFKGLLDWPTGGRVSAGFGTMVHPRFKTEVPHPGLDIEGSVGTPIRSVFDGRIVFAGWLRGYGLTAIVDHGGGLLSIYAHAGVLLVQGGEEVLRGQTLGQVGDTGSLRGAYLYFELRFDGRPTDPGAWLRPR